MRIKDFDKLNLVKLAYGVLDFRLKQSNLSSLLPQQYLKNTLATKLVKRNPKIIISLCQSKTMTHSVCFKYEKRLDMGRNKGQRVQPDANTCFLSPSRKRRSESDDLASVCYSKNPLTKISEHLYKCRTKCSEMSKNFMLKTVIKSISRQWLLIKNCKSVLKGAKG